jgi:hypothetical protein
MKTNITECAICGNDLVPFGLNVTDPEMVWGNNPQPIINDPSAKCCDGCNFSVVIPARIANPNWREPIRLDPNDPNNIQAR